MNSALGGNFAPREARGQGAGDSGAGSSRAPGGGPRPPLRSAPAPSPSPPRTGVNPVVGSPRRGDDDGRPAVAPSPPSDTRRISWAAGHARMRMGIICPTDAAVNLALPDRVVEGLAGMAEWDQEVLHAQLPADAAQAQEGVFPPPRSIKVPDQLAKDGGGVYGLLVEDGTPLALGLLWLVVAAEGDAAVLSFLSELTLEACMTTPWGQTLTGAERKAVEKRFARRAEREAAIPAILQEESEAAASANEAAETAASKMRELAATNDKWKELGGMACAEFVTARARKVAADAALTAAMSGAGGSSAAPDTAILDESKAADAAMAAAGRQAQEEQEKAVAAYAAARAELEEAEAAAASASAGVGRRDEEAVRLAAGVHIAMLCGILVDIDQGTRPVQEYACALVDEQDYTLIACACRDNLAWWKPEAPPSYIPPAFYCLADSWASYWGHWEDRLGQASGEEDPRHGLTLILDVNREVLRLVASLRSQFPVVRIPGTKQNVSTEASLERVAAFMRTTGLRGAKAMIANLREEVTAMIGVVGSSALAAPSHGTAVVGEEAPGLQTVAQVAGKFAEVAESRAVHALSDSVIAAADKTFGECLALAKRLPTDISADEFVSPDAMMGLMSVRKNKVAHQPPKDWEFDREVRIKPHLRVPANVAKVIEKIIADVAGPDSFYFFTEVNLFRLVVGQWAQGGHMQWDQLMVAVRKTRGKFWKNVSRSEVEFAGMSDTSFALIRSFVSALERIRPLVPAVLYEDSDLKAIRDLVHECEHSHGDVKPLTCFRYIIDAFEVTAADLEAWALEWGPRGPDPGKYSFEDAIRAKPSLRRKLRAWSLDTEDNKGWLYAQLRRGRQDRRNDYHSMRGAASDAPPTYLVYDASRGPPAGDAGGSQESGPRQTGQKRPLDFDPNKETKIKRYEEMDEKIQSLTTKEDWSNMCARCCEEGHTTVATYGVCKKRFVDNWVRVLPAEWSADRKADCNKIRSIIRNVRADIVAMDKASGWQAEKRSRKAARGKGGRGGGASGFQARGLRR